MQAFVEHSGKVVAIDRSNIDTDQIIPKQFLKRIERTGFGQFLFYDWRFDSEGQPIPEFVLNRPEHQEASILVSRQNYGSGSSREHAVWALADYGFRCVIAESFADIFYNNCSKNGLLPIVLTPDEVQSIVDQADANPEYRLSIDLREQSVSDGGGLNTSFEIDPFRKECFLEGLDQISLTLQQEEKIAAYEQQRQSFPAAC